MTINLEKDEHKTSSYYDKDGDGVPDYIKHWEYALDENGDPLIYEWTQKLVDVDNPAPDDPAGEYVHPWQKNPLNPGQSTYPLHPAVIGLERALLMDGGHTLVQGGRNRDSLVNPADDDTSGNSGPKPKTQTTKGVATDLPILSEADLTVIQEQIGAANGLALGDAAYVQLHNPAGQQGGTDDGDDDAPTTTAGPKKDGPMTPGGNGMPSLWDLKHESLVNPPTDASEAGGSFVLVPPSVSGLNVHSSPSGPTADGSSLNFAGFGGGSSSRTGVPRPPR
jgi:hypothetical protein